MRTLLVAIAALFAIHVAMVFADEIAGPMPAMVLDHDMLQSLARTGPAKDIRIEYLPDRLLFKTRIRRLVWIDIRLEARFGRVAGKVQLVAQRLTAGGILQNASRFDEAREKLSHLVNVETAAGRVEIYKAGQRVYAQDLLP